MISSLLETTYTLNLAEILVVYVFFSTTWYFFGLG